MKIVSDSNSVYYNNPNTNISRRGSVSDGFSNVKSFDEVSKMCIRDSFQTLRPSCGADKSHPHRHTDNAHLAEDGSANLRCGHMPSCLTH